MLGCQHQVGGAEEGVGSGGEDRDGHLESFEAEAHLGPLAAADPVTLEELDRVGPIQAVEIGDQTLRVGGDAKHPLAHRTALHGKASHLALAVDDLLVGQHGSESGAPVHRHLRDKGEPHAVGVVSLVGGDRLRLVGRRIHPGAVELEEDPLGPAEVLRIGRADLA